MVSITEIDSYRQPFPNKRRLSISIIGVEWQEDAQPQGVHPRVPHRIKLKVGEKARLDWGSEHDGR